MHRMIPVQKTRAIPMASATKANIKAMQTSRTVSRSRAASAFFEERGGARTVDTLLIQKDHAGRGIEIALLRSLKPANKTPV